MHIALQESHLTPIVSNLILRALKIHTYKMSVKGSNIIIIIYGTSYLYKCAFKDKTTQTLELLINRLCKQSRLVAYHLGTSFIINKYNFN